MIIPVDAMSEKHKSKSPLLVVAISSYRARSFHNRNTNSVRAVLQFWIITSKADSINCHGNTNLVS